MQNIQHFINGKIYSSTSSSTSSVYNPALGEQTASLNHASKTDVLYAIDCAQKAFLSWSQVSPLKRSRIIFKVKEFIEKDINHLTTMLSNEHGKIYSDAKAEIQRGLEVVEFACGIPHLLKGEYSDQLGTNVDGYNMRQPLGIIGCITPFNFPVMIPLWMSPIAIGCGNSVILKPSEKTPSCAMKLAEYYHEAGCPDGVFNVLNGSKDVVNTLIEDKRVQALSFVGSTPIAKYIYEKGTAYGKRVQALGGAKNHLVVMPDANLDKVCDGLMGAAYGSAGERCMAISVAVPVGKETADKLVAALSERLKDLKVGPGNDPNNEMGPLVTKEHLNKVLGYVDIGVNEGANLVVDGRNISLKSQGKGFFMGGCLFDNVKPSMKIYQEEIFGPVLSIVRENSLTNAINLINNHPFGNGNVIFTNNGSAARQFSHSVQTGMVGINIPIPVPMAFYSFGGWKASLYGDHHMHGMEGIRFFTKYKNVAVRWFDETNESSSSQFSMPTL